LKRAIVAALPLLLLASAVFAQSGAVCIFTDDGGAACDFVDTTPGLVTLYIFHTQTPGAKAVQFAAPIPPCMVGATFISDDDVFPVTIGNSQDGVSVGYGDCLSGPIHVLTVNILASGTSTPNCAYPITPDPSAGQVEMLDCNDNTLLATGGVAYINSGTPCACSAVPVPPQIDASPSQLVFGTDLVSLDVAVTNIGGGALSWSAQPNAPWISVTPDAGSGDATVTVAIDRTGLSPGDYLSSVTLSSNGGIVDVTVYMAVEATGPILNVSATDVHFPPAINAAAFNITNDGIGSLHWSLTESMPWLTARPTSGGQNIGLVHLDVDRTGLTIGTYEGDMAITSNGGDANVHVTMIVDSDQIPLLSVSPLDVNVGTGSSGSFHISNAGAGNLTWSLAESAPWLTLSTESGLGDATITVSVDRTGLQTGFHSAAVSVTSNGGNETVTVTMTVEELEQPVLSVTPLALDFGENLVTLQVTISNTGNGTLLWGVNESLSWLSVSPGTGSGGQTLTVTALRAGLSPGAYSGSFQVTSNGGNATVDVAVVKPDLGDPVLVVGPTVLNLSALQTNASFLISNGGTGTLSWVVQESIPWLTASPTSGTDGGVVTVTVDRTGLADGTYFDGILVTSNGGNAGVAVVMEVSGPLVVSPTVLSFGSSQTEASFTISSADSSDVTWDVSESLAWASVSPASGAGVGTVTVTVNRNGLAPGTYSGDVFVASNLGNATVALTMVVDLGLAANPTLLDFGSSQTVQSFNIFNIGSGALNWDVAESLSWASVSPVSGAGNGVVTVTIDRTGLTPGSYNGEVFVTSNSGGATISLIMTVLDPAPVLAVSPSSLLFAVMQDSLILNISNAGTEDLDWNISGSEGWVSVSPSSGTNDTPVTVVVNRSGLGDGTYNANVSVTSNGGGATVPVTMHVATGPILNVDKSTLSFVNANDTKTFNISNAGIPTLNWSVTADEPWIDIHSLPTGSGPSAITVGVIEALIPLAPQSTGHIDVASNGGDASIEVRFFRSGAGGPPGLLGIYGDPNGTNCDTRDVAGLLQIYVVHTLTGGVLASQFSAPQPACMVGAVYLGDSSPFQVNVGTSQAGIAVAYGACLGAPIHVLTISYFSAGQVSTCCPYPILPDPSVGVIFSVDCASRLMTATGIANTINGNSTCSCSSLPTEQSTWGRVKALYAPNSPAIRRR
jgi:hypothetical protein